MSYKLINEALQDINALRRSSKFTKISSTTLGDIKDYEGSQGEYNDIIEIYSLGSEDLYIKLIFRTDSYGENESLISVSIVKPIVKQVTDFEPVK